MRRICGDWPQKSWANNELFNLLATVSTEPHTQAVHTAIRTLNHICVVDRIFQAHLLGETHGHSATNTGATPELGELQLAVADTDTWFERYTATVDDRQPNERITFLFTDGDAGTMSREEMLLHVILHGACHRGTVGQVLKSTSIAPPRDLNKFLHVREHPSRAKSGSRGCF